MKLPQSILASWDAGCSYWIARAVAQFDGLKIDERWPSHWPTSKLVLGHRGAPKIAPENSAVGMRIATQHGANGVEFDVQMSSDGVPVIMHDDTLDRTTNSQGVVGTYSFAQLKQIRLKDSLGLLTKETVPSLALVLETLADRALVNIELKALGNWEIDPFLQAVLSVVKPHEKRVHIVYSSFHCEWLLRLRQMSSKEAIGMLWGRNSPHLLCARRWIRQIRPQAIHLPPGMITPELIDLAHQKGLKVLCWTINDFERARYWFGKHIDGIFTDDVDSLVRNRV